VDEDYLGAIFDAYDLTVIVEEGIKAGGFGEYAVDLAARQEASGRVLALAVEDPFGPQGKREDLIRRNGLDGPGIAAAVRGRIREASGLRKAALGLSF
jgi:1-deoxy-D-xylulose-5-phosphate synthase